MKTSIVNLLFERGMCSGVVLENKVVITAAHCQDMLGTPVLASWLGAEDDAGDCSFSEVADSAYVPEAEPILPLHVHAPDLLLLKLKNRLCGTIPAKLSQWSLKPGDLFFQAGHGAGSGDFYTAHQVELKLIDNQAPEEFVSPLRKLSKRLLQRGASYYQFALPVKEKTSACKNDSGGPSFIEQDGQMILYAVSGAVLPNKELGAPQCDHFYLHLIAPVAPYYEWIKNKVKNW